jgi:hypothetical protein
MRDQFGLDVDTNYFSTTKSGLMAGSKAKSSTTTGSKGKAEKGSSGSLVELSRDLEALRRLREKYGVAEVKRLLEEG